MRLNSGVIVGLVLTLVMAVVLFKVLPVFVPLAATAISDMYAGMTNTTVYGTGAVSFASEVPGLLGWFWVIGPFILAIALIVGLFMRNRR